MTLRRRAERSWLWWLALALPACALGGLLYGVLMEFGPIGNDDRKGWLGVLVLAVFFGGFLFAMSIFEEVRRRRKLKSRPSGSRPDRP